MQPLKPYQQEAINSLISKRKLLLLARVGAGKTRIALEGFKALRVVGRVQHALVLGTKRICNLVWPQEAAKWCPDLSVSSLAGLTESQRHMIVDARPDILCCNYENLPWLVKAYGKRLPEMYDFLIVDESSKLRSPSGQRFKAMRSLITEWGHVLAMTGTPRPNYLHQLWGQAYLIDQGRALGKYHQAFLQAWFTPEERRYGGHTIVKWHPKPHAYDDILERLKPICHVVNPDDVETPQVDTTTVQVQLPPDAARYLREIRQCIRDQRTLTLSGVTFVKDGEPDLNKLLQFSSGAVYRNDGSGWVHFHDAKMEALEEILDEAQGEPLIVVYMYQHEAERIMERWSDARLMEDDQGVVEAWNRGEIPILLLHPLSAGHGLNLQVGGHLMLWFSPTWDAELYTQTVGRLARTGQKGAVTVFRLVTVGMWDGDAYAAVDNRVKAEQGLIADLL